MQISGQWSIVSLFHCYDPLLQSDHSQCCFEYYEVIPFGVCELCMLMWLFCMCGCFRKTNFFILLSYTSLQSMSIWSINGLNMPVFVLIDRVWMRSVQQSQTAKLLRLPMCQDLQNLTDRAFDAVLNPSANLTISSRTYSRHRNTLEQGRDDRLDMEGLEGRLRSHFLSEWVWLYYITHLSASLSFSPSFSVP